MFNIFFLLQSVYSLQLFVLTDGPQEMKEKYTDLLNDWSKAKGWLESIFLATGSESGDDTHFISRFKLIACKVLMDFRLDYVAIACKMICFKFIILN